MGGSQGAHGTISGEPQGPSSIGKYHRAGSSAPPTWPQASLATLPYAHNSEVNAVADCDAPLGATPSSPYAPHGSAGRVRGWCTYHRRGALICPRSGALASLGCCNGPAAPSVSGLGLCCEAAGCTGRPPWKRPVFLPSSSGKSLHMASDPRVRRSVTTRLTISLKNGPSSRG